MASIYVTKKIFENAYDNYKDDLKRYSYFKVHNDALAEDIVQDTFMRVWKYVVGGGEVDMMRAFLYRILNNLITDEYRKKKSSSLDSLMEAGFEPGTDETARLIDSLDGKQTITMVEKLPPQYRTVISLKYVKNLSLKEIAAKTHQTKNTVAVQINRGMKKLKSIYDHAGKVPEHSNA